MKYLVILRTTLKLSSIFLFLHIFSCKKSDPVPNSSILSTNGNTFQKDGLTLTNEYTNYLNQSQTYNISLDTVGIFITKDNSFNFYAISNKNLKILITIKDFNNSLNTNAVFQLNDGTSGIGNIQFYDLNSSHASGSFNADLYYSSGWSRTKISGIFNKIPISIEPSYINATKTTYGFSNVTAIFTQIPYLDDPNKGNKFTFSCPFSPVNHDSSNYISFGSQQNGYYLRISLPKNISLGNHPYNESGINVGFGVPISVHYTSGFYLNAGSINILTNDLPSRTIEGEMNFFFENTLATYGNRDSYSVTGGYFKVKY